LRGGTEKVGAVAGLEGRDTGQEGAGNEVGFFHGFGGDGAVEVFGEGLEEEMQPAAEMAFIDGEGQVFGEGVAGVVCVAEEGHAPESGVWSLAPASGGG
jgi:hypothetical protein